MHMWARLIATLFLAGFACNYIMSLRFNFYLRVVLTFIVGYTIGNLILR